MRKCLIPLLFSCLILSSCKAAGGRAIAAKVDGEPIYKDEFALELKFELSKYDSEILNDSKRLEEIKKSLLERSVKDLILYSYAKKKGLSISEEELAKEYTRFKSRYTEASFQKMLELKGIKYDRWKEDKRREALIDRLIEQEVISKINITDADIRKYYKQHRRDFSRGDEVHARQILVDSQKLAEEIYLKIRGGENFAALAKEFSIAPEGRRGGDLGWFERGVMPKEFDEACFPLPAGSISPVIKTNFGYHIFKVIERRPAASLKIDDVKEKITARLKQERIDEAFNTWYEPIRKKANVEINEDVLKTVEMPKEEK